MVMCTKILFGKDCFSSVLIRSCSKFSSYVPILILINDNVCLTFIMPHETFRFGPYFCQPVIAGLGDDDVPFICTMDCIGAKYASVYAVFFLNKCFGLFSAWDYCVLGS